MSYQKLMQVSDDIILYTVLPYILKDDAHVWYETQSIVTGFNSLTEFMTKFRRHFQSVDYFDSLRRDLDKRTQGEEETLTEYITGLIGFYKRLGGPTDFSDISKKIRTGLNPTYIPLFREIAAATSLGDLMKTAEELDDVLERRLKYAPPPTIVSNEQRLNYVAKSDNERRSRESRRDRYEKGDRRDNNRRYFQSGRDFSKDYNSSGYRSRGNSYGRSYSPGYTSTERDRFQRGDQSSNKPYYDRQAKEVTYDTSSDRFRDSTGYNNRLAPNSPHPNKVPRAEPKQTQGRPPGILKENPQNGYDSSRSRNSSTDRSRGSSPHSKTQDPSARSPSKIVCHKCGGNHYANHCPDKSNRSLNIKSPARGQ
ncbi:unnamed protein product [Orchesella dallaii]|uniref:Retrotransposon gag domain-containing protein n=1 Tax=Orchesella dallaii TaxID=48710 RepID=A0ABP1S7U5_9HEXA